MSKHEASKHSNQPGKLKLEAVISDFSNVLLFASANQPRSPMSWYYSELQGDEDKLATFSLNEELLEYYLDLSHQGIRCALLTAANTLPRHPRIKPMLDRVFAEYFFSQEIGLSKADPRCYEHVLAELGTNPYNSLFIDDSLSNCQAAESVGLQTHHFQGNIHLFREIEKKFSIK